MSEIDKVVIGLVGENGAGKGTFSRLLTEIVAPKTVTVVSTKTLLQDTLDLWQIESSRRNLQQLAIIMAKQFGKDALPNSIKGRINSSPSYLVILDCVRLAADLNLLRTFPKHSLIYIHAKPRFRFERLIQRGEKIDERSLTWERFVFEENIATETMIPVFGKIADFRINNDSSLDQFREEITKFTQKFQLI